MESLYSDATKAMLQIGYGAISNRIKRIRKLNTTKAVCSFNNKKRKIKEQRKSRRNNR